MDKNKSLKIEFTIQNLFTITLFFLSLYFLWAVRGVVLVLFIAFIISSALSPLVHWLERRKVKKNIAVVIIYILSLLIVVGLVMLMVFPLAAQVTAFVQKLPELTEQFLEKVKPLLGSYFAQELDGGLDSLLSEFAKQAVGLSDNLFQVIKQAWGVFGAIIGSISVVILSLYMLIEHDNAVSAFLTVLPVTNRVRALKIITEIEDQMGRWFRGQMALSLIIGIMTWVAIEIMGLPFAFPLALIAGALEIIPNLGPTLAAVPALILAIAVGSVPQMIAVPIVYWLIQQIENTYIVPQVMKRAVGLNPLITMVAFLIGAEIAGVPGMLLAVPVAAVVQILIKELGE